MPSLAAFANLIRQKLSGEDYELLTSALRAEAVEILDRLAALGDESADGEAPGGETADGASPPGPP